MFAAVLLAVAPGPDVNPVAALPEAQAFGVDGPTARAMWRVACQHPQAMRAEVTGWNRPQDVTSWEAECEWRRACWDKADDVFFHTCSLPYKLRSLQRLRELIGEENYARGVLPSPIPQYRR
jgi:hypothetical protein